MSSDNAIIKIISKNGKEIVFSTHDTFNGGNEYGFCGFITRSFVLSAFYNPWFEVDRTDRPENFLKKVLSNEEEGWFDSEEWFEENIADYIALYEVVERQKLIENEQQEEELEQKMEAMEDSLEAMLTYAPTAICRAIFTDEKWISHLLPSDIFGTTAYDVWKKEELIAKYLPDDFEEEEID